MYMILEFERYELLLGEETKEAPRRLSDTP
jgi:hypothetical protein